MTCVTTLQENSTPAVPALRRSVEIPLRGGKGTFHTFQSFKDGKEHFAVSFGEYWRQSAPLVRVHSECMTGDVFGSGKCDCGEQLQEAVDRMQKEGGILLYLRQEGRGIGLFNKLDAYALQQAGLDTYEANEMLGLPADLRSYRVAAQMLTALGVTRVRLLSNNPDKAEQLEKLGISVSERVKTGVFQKDGNRGYLAAKVSKTGHLLALK